MKYSGGGSCGWVELWFEVQRKCLCARDAELGIIIKAIVRPWKFQTFDKTCMNSSRVQCFLTERQTPIM